MLVDAVHRLRQLQWAGRASRQDRLRLLISTERDRLVWRTGRGSERGLLTAQVFIPTPEMLYQISGDWSPVLQVIRRQWFRRIRISQEVVLARALLVACGLETIPSRQVSGYYESEALPGMVPGDSVAKAALKLMDMISWVPDFSDMEALPISVIGYSTARGQTGG
jgi:hypothetical protein